MSLFLGVTLELELGLKVRLGYEGKGDRDLFRAVCVGCLRGGLLPRLFALVAVAQLQPDRVAPEPDQSAQEILLFRVFLLIVAVAHLFSGERAENMNAHVASG